MRGVFLLRPSLPRYNVTWDVNIVLEHIRLMSPLSSLSLLKLSQKLLMLLALLSGQRGQTLHLLNIRNIHITNEYVKIGIGDILKTSKPGRHLGELNFPAFTPDEDLCVARTLQFYLQKTDGIRGTINKLFITTQKPFKAISRDTLSRWMKDTLQAAGIDLTIFKPHSTRAAATSAASALKVPTSTILKTVGWAQECTFRKFYKKTVAMDRVFSESLLEHFSTVDQ